MVTLNIFELRPGTLIKVPDGTNAQTQQGHVRLSGYWKVARVVPVNPYRSVYGLHLVPHDYPGKLEEMGRIPQMQLDATYSVKCNAKTEVMAIAA